MRSTKLFLDRRVLSIDSVQSVTIISRSLLWRWFTGLLTQDCSLFHRSTAESATFPSRLYSILETEEQAGDLLRNAQHWHVI